MALELVLGGRLKELIGEVEDLSFLINKFLSAWTGTVSG